MDPILIYALLFIIVPLMLFVTLCGPVYIGLWTSLYWIYYQDGEKLHQIQEMKFDTSKVIDQYSQLYDYWVQHGDKVEFYSFTLPLFLPPLIGALFSILFTFRFMRSVRNIFRVTD